MFKSINILFLVSLTGSLFFNIGCQTAQTADNRFDESYFYLVNEILISEDQTEFNKFTWSGGRKAFERRNQIPKADEQVEVDIINCAGYLGSGKATYIEDFEWRMKLIPDTIPSNQAERIRGCATRSGTGSEVDLVVAVLRKGKNRKDAKTGEISGQEAFADLPKDVQEWANCERENQNTLGNGADDDWMDTDGNGKIDIVRISAACQGNGMCENKGDYTCTKWLKLINGKWVELSFSRPA